MCGFFYDPEAVGPSASLDPGKIQEAALRFYDKLWDVDLQSVLGPMHRRRIILCPGLAARAATRKILGKNRTSRLRMATSTTIGTTCPPLGNSIQPESWMTGKRDADLEAYLAGESDWIHCDLLDSDTLDSYVEEDCSADKNLYEAFLEYKKGRDTLNQVRRGRGFWPAIAILAPDRRSATLSVRGGDDTLRGGKGKDSKGTTHKGKSKGSKGGRKVVKVAAEAKARVTIRALSKVRVTLCYSVLVSRTQCRLCGEEGHWEEDCPR